MTFRLGLKKLALIARQLGQMLEAGIALRRGLTVMERGAKPPLNTLYRRLGHDIESGHTFSEALGRQGRRFPILFLRLVQVGEAVGGLDVILKRIADYYETMRSLWLHTIIRLIYPMFLYWALVLVLSGLRAILLYLATQDEFAALMVFLQGFAIGVGVFLTPIVLYFGLTRILGGSRTAHIIVNSVPVFGHVMRTLAIARFSLAMEMMTEGGVQIFNAITWSMEATANGAFTAHTRRIISTLRDGMPLHQALANTGLFPVDYTEVIRVAGESGSMPDSFRRLARNYLDKATTALTVASWTLCVLMLVAMFAVFIVVIFTFFMKYLNALKSQM